MKYSEVSGMSATELKKKKAALTEELFNAKMKNKLGQLGNPLEIRRLRKDVARIQTAMVQKIAR